MILKFQVQRSSTRRRVVRILPGLDRLQDRIAPATFKVNTMLHTVAVDLRTGKDAAGHISLRSAIMAADAKPNSDTIKLPRGTYTLTLAGANEDSDATGDLDIIGNLTIMGSGSARTIIDGNYLDRVIHILGGKAIISRVTTQHGRSGQGAGLLVAAGQVSLASVSVLNNQAVGDDGGGGAAGGLANGGGGGRRG